MKVMTWLIIFLKLLLSDAVYSGYKYGDDVVGYKFAGGISYVLAWSNQIATTELCKQKCLDYVPSPGTPDCSLWDYKPTQNGFCGIGHGDAPFLEDQYYISGWNKDVCGSVLNCNQNSICGSWSNYNENWLVTGSKRILSTGRCYYAYVPDICKDNTANTACKVVFNFGGVKKNALPWAGDRTLFTNYVTGQSANSHSWGSNPGIVIYPQKYAITGGWQFIPGRSGLCTYDDAQYTYDILTDLTQNNIHWDGIDGGVYAVGHGNGGHFVFDLVARLENDHNVVLNAIGTYSGNSLTDHGGTVQLPQTSLDIMIVQGYNDITHPYGGHVTTGCDMGKTDSQSLANWWATAMNCDPNPVIDACHSGATCSAGPNEKERHYTNCDSGVDVRLKSPNSGYEWTTAGDAIFPDFFRNH